MASSAASADSLLSSGGDTGEVVRTAGGVGAVLAAALVGVLATRRARERRRRRPGERIGAGDASDRSAETELRQAADPVAVEVVDRVLRGLAARLARAGRGLPPLRAVRLTRRTLEVYLAAPAELPAPFVGTAHGGVWTVPLDAVGDGEAADVPAPYPSLVTLGHDHDDALVLLDLEQVGTLVLDGAPELVRSALTAVAAELATSAWADDLRVTLVGAQALADLDLLDTGRVRHVTEVEDLLAELTVRVADDRLLLATAGVNSLGAARVAQVADAAWTPEIVVIAEPLPAEQWDRLEALIVTAPRVAVAAVVGTGEPSDLPSRGHRLRERVRHAGGGTWVLRLSGPPGRVTAVLDPLGVLVRPQLLDEETHGRFLRLLRAAAGSDGSASEPAARVDQVLDGVSARSADGSKGVGGEPDSVAGGSPAGDHRGRAGAAGGGRRRGGLSGDDGRGDGVPGGRARGGAASGERESELGDGSVGGGTQRDGGATPGGRRRSGGASAGGAGVASGDGAGDRGSGEAGTGYGSSDSAGRRSTDRRSADPAPVGGRDEASPAGGSSQGRTAREPSQGRPSGGASPRRPSGASHSAAAPRAGQDGASLFAESIGPATYGRGRSLPRLLMLGPVGVENAAELGEHTKLGQLTELAMFIALNPGCDATAIDEAIWPGSAVTKTTRGTAISKLRRWLGTDADGESLLPRTESGYTLRPLVRSDWDDWRDLLPHGTSRAATADLRAALQLVRGRPFSGRGRRRYAWADHLAQEMIASIVDVCHELALRSLVERDPWEALRAALLGLSVEPGMELLWRDRLKAEAAIGDGKVVLDSVEWLRATAVDLGGELEAETEDLIEELSSGWAGATRSPAGR
ncbi:hypothetical protein C1I92_01530 [Jiangella anatolica]|uniref:Bacterial transcriptional activator domain-containing protein n=1 Tax=Jiangella anatolica TaxID=2670374 RepID=A0A2W2D1W4_9ACTN|nr:hypothetical protein C1I92_01530 [Jiangella anatolica]